MKKNLYMTYDIPVPTLFSCSKARWLTCTPSSLRAVRMSTLWLELVTEDILKPPKTVQVYHFTLNNLYMYGTAFKISWVEFKVP